MFDITPGHDQLTESFQIVTNVVVQIIILLYLIDNNEQTSWMILMGSGVGVLIEAWKVMPVLSLPRVFSDVAYIDHQGCRYQPSAFPSGITTSV